MSSPTRIIIAWKWRGHRVINADDDMLIAHQPQKCSVGSLCNVLIWSISFMHCTLIFIPLWKLFGITISQQVIASRTCHTKKIQYANQFDLPFLSCLITFGGSVFRMICVLWMKLNRHPLDEVHEMQQFGCVCVEVVFVLLRWEIAVLWSRSTSSPVMQDEPLKWSIKSVWLPLDKITYCTRAATAAERIIQSHSLHTHIQKNFQKQDT